MVTITNASPSLPLDVASRLEGLFLHIADIKQRATTPPALNDLINDFENVAHEYIVVFNQALDKGKLKTKDKWQKIHEAVDKLINEWGTISSLVATHDLGSSYLSQFDDFLEQAKKDLGLTDPKDRFVLFPTFGNYFAVTRFRYSTKPFYMFRLPISSLSAPWEWSVIWHELAGIKVNKISKQLQSQINKFVGPNNTNTSKPNEKKEDRKALIDELFNRIINKKNIDEDFQNKLRSILTRITTFQETETKSWSLDWLEQLYEDACSVLAFGDVFVFVLEKILSRNPAKLSSDRKHPNLEIRLGVANRINELKKGSGQPAKDRTEELADKLLWDFIISQKDNPDCALPVAFETLDDVPPARKTLIKAMEDFRDNFDKYSSSSDIFRNVITAFTPRDQIYYQSPPTDIAPERKRMINEKFSFAEIKEDVDSLLTLAFSSTDELDINSHNHIPNDPNESTATHGNTVALAHSKYHDVIVAVHT